MAGLDTLSLLGALNVDGVAESHKVEVEAAAADIIEVVIPFHCQVETFGAYIAETFVAHATDPIVKLQKKPTVGGTATDQISLTLGSSNTNLKKGDGSKALVTVIAADTDLANGHVVYAKRGDNAVQYAPGDVLTIRHATAAGEAGGAYIPFCRLRVTGPDFTKTKTWVEDA